MLALSLSISACGGTPWRYTPERPERTAGLTATAGNGQVALSWSAAARAAAYDVYYATSPGVTAKTGTKIPAVTNTSTIVTGLANDVTYYFAVAAVNSSGEGPLSTEVFATPSPPGSFQQADLQGTWYFNILVSGPAGGWMRGIATIDGSGNAAVTSFLDNGGNTVAPSGLFTAMTLLPDGNVVQPGGTTGFHGTLSAGQYKDLLVATSSPGASRLLMVLQKRVPGITYTSSDIKGTGKLVAGPLTFAYHQLSSGAGSEWEYATGQIGQDQAVTYLSIHAPTPRQLPGGGSKVVTVAITADGIVTEAPVAGILPQPSALMTWGVMSADKMTVVGTATDGSGAFLLRVMQFIHPPSIPLTASSYVLSDLAGTFALHLLDSGAAPLWAYGGLAFDSAGTAAFTSYRDSNGGTALPAPFTLAMDQQGTLTNGADPTFQGRFSYFKDMVVATGTDSLGAGSLTIALKR